MIRLSWPFLIGAYFGFVGLVYAQSCPSTLTIEGLVSQKFHLAYLGVGATTNDGVVQGLFFVKEKCRCGIDLPPTTKIKVKDIEKIESWRKLAELLSSNNLTVATCPPGDKLDSESPYNYCYNINSKSCPKKES